MGLDSSGVRRIIMKEYVKNILRKGRDVVLPIKGKVEYSICKNKSLRDKFDESKITDLWDKVQVNCVVDEKLPAPEIDLSIIIPLYNSERFIDKCLQSFLNQNTKYKYELVLIDDGSTDRTNEIVKSYSENYPNIVKLVTQPNGGISVARNTGLLNSKGKYISFADHDDWVSEQYVEVLMENAFQENADIVKCEFSTVKNDVVIQTEKRSRRVIKGDMKDNLFDYSSYIWGGIYRRDLLEKVRFPEKFWYEDMITRMLLYRQSKTFVDVGKNLYFKLSHATNASKVVWNNKEYKCIEQLYLPEALIMNSQKIGLKIDVYAYECLLLEYSAMLYKRTKRLPEEIKKQVFLYARNTLMKLYRSEFEATMSPKWKKWHMIFSEKKYDAWKALGAV